MDHMADERRSIDPAAIDPFRRGAFVLFTMLVAVSAIGLILILADMSALDPGSPLGLLFLNGLLGLASWSP